MLICGICCCIISVSAYYSRPSLILISVVCSAAMGIMLYRNVSFSLVFAIFMVFLMILSSIIATGNAEYCSKLVDKKYNCKLAVCDITYEANDYFIADMQVLKSDTLKSGLRISAGYNDIELQPGQIINACVSIENHNDTYKPELFSRKIYISGKIENLEIATHEKDLILTGFFKVRKYIEKTFFKEFGYNQASTLCAVIFGENAYFSDDFYSKLKSTGVSHVMVVSGMHLSILLALTTFFFKKLFFNRYALAIITVISVLSLTALCGFTMSILRAGVTYLLVALGFVIKRDGVPENTLGAAVSLILIVSPFSFMSIAFRLSVLSTLGIVAVAIKINESVRELMPLKSAFAIFSAITVTNCAFLFTLPVTVSEFGYISLISVFSNLLIGIAVTFMIWFAFLGLIVNLFSQSLSQIFFFPCGILTKYVNSSINNLGELDFAVMELPKGVAFLATVFILFVFWYMTACKKTINQKRTKEKQKIIISQINKKINWK